MNGFRFIRYVLLCQVTIVAAVIYAQSVDIDAEMSRLKRELSQVREERLRNRTEAAQDRADFLAYEERATARRRALAAELDSVGRMIVEHSRRHDSLTALIVALEAKKRQFELKQRVLRERVLAACETLSGQVAYFPPGVARPSLGALTFLAADCKGKNIDVMEALNRLAQIVHNIEEASLTIETAQQSSPVPQIGGVVSVVRVGALFEAVVDEKGERCAVWCGADSAGTPLWRTIDDRQTAERLRQAIAIREGKAVPAFVDFPLGQPCGGGVQ